MSTASTLDEIGYDGPTDPYRVAAVLLYARGDAAWTYAQSRQADAQARGDAAAARHWRNVGLCLSILRPLTPPGEQTLH